MTMSYYRLMGQIFVAVQTWDNSPDVMEATSKVGLTKDRIAAGRLLVDEGQALIARRQVEAGGDRIAGHSIHTAASEVEMWLQTVRFSLRDRLDDPSVIDRVIDHGLHAEDHTVTVVATALRALGVLRTDPAVEQAYERRQTLRDLIVRGRTLLAKLLECTDVLVRDNVTSLRSDIFDQLEAHRQKMSKWVLELAKSSEKIKDQPEILGLLGYVPQGVGIPAGGTSFAVILHQRAQRQAPDPTEPGSTSGWSIGRQGRNRENMGKGWVEPTFEG